MVQQEAYAFAILLVFLSSLFFEALSFLLLLLLLLFVAVTVATILLWKPRRNHNEATVKLRSFDLT
jgi:membrane protein implicated in regulation of membrane protease activity